MTQQPSLCWRACFFQSNDTTTLIIQCTCFFKSNDTVTFFFVCTFSFKSNNTRTFCWHACFLEQWSSNLLFIGIIVFFKSNDTAIFSLLAYSTTTKKQPCFFFPMPITQTFFLLGVCLGITNDPSNLVFIAFECQQHQEDSLFGCVCFSIAFSPRTFHSSKCFIFSNIADHPRGSPIGCLSSHPTLLWGSLFPLWSSQGSVIETGCLPICFWLFLFTLLWGRQ